MPSSDQIQKGFLLGSILLGVLIIGGLAWAIASGPGPAARRAFNDQNDPVYGAQTNHVVRMYGDFQCPACRSAESAVKAIREKYKDRVKFIWNDFPLQSLHANALLAANAARCAEAQGKFWEYHDKLYEDQPSWDSLQDPSQKFKDYANALDIQAEPFAVCLASREHQPKIMDDLKEGERIGVNATPTFYLNDVQAVGVFTLQEWEAKIQALLSEGATSPR